MEAHGSPDSANKGHPQRIHDSFIDRNSGNQTKGLEDKGQEHGEYRKQPLFKASIGGMHSKRTQPFPANVSDNDAEDLSFLSSDYLDHVDSSNSQNYGKCLRFHENSFDCEKLFEWAAVHGNCFDQDDKTFIKILLGLI